jgi:quercetin dioxygenase-like cupin family protein
MTEQRSDSRSGTDLHGSAVPADGAPPLSYRDNLLELAPVPASGLGHSTVLNSPQVRVIVLAFPAGHVLKQHAAPFTLLMQALDGHLLVTSAGRELDLRPGGLIRMDAALPHSVEAYEDSRLMLTLISG